MIRRVLASLALLFMLALPVSAQELHQDVEEVVRGEVTAILKEAQRSIAGSETTALVQTLGVRLLSGRDAGHIVEVENDLTRLEVGEKVYLNHLSFIDGTELYSVRGVDRKNGILLMFALFAGAVIALGGRQGMRSLISLAGSFVLIAFVLLPLFLKGYSPLLVSTLVGSLILGIAIMATHGVHARSLIAWSGATISIVVTALAAIFGTDLLHLTGFFSDETVFLNLNTEGTLDLQGLLVGGIIIGVLGVLDDIAITQVAVVAELKDASATLSRRELYEKGLRVGREHVSALVNTIVLAYAGVALPLLLLFSQSGSSLIDILNNEIFATEIVRTIAGSLGLIATVPITTALAAYFAPVLRTHGKTHHSHHHHHP
jgi:uncharacterized membrane protein